MGLEREAQAQAGFLARALTGHLGKGGGQRRDQHVLRIGAKGARGLLQQIAGQGGVEHQCALQCSAMGPWGDRVGGCCRQQQRREGQGAACAIGLVQPGAPAGLGFG